MSLPFKVGSNGPEIRAWQDWAYKNYASYATLIGSKDAYYGLGEKAFTTEMQRRLGLPQTGVFDVQTASRVKYKGAPPAPAYRPIWIYTAPGSGADWWLGPSFDLGEMVSGNRPGDPNRQSLHINHQPLLFAKGGYLGLMGGDPSLSYVDVTYDQYKSLEYNLDHNPDLANPNLELWFSAYSQSADGTEDALEILFGDGGFVIPKTGETVGPGKYRHLRDRINGVVQYGNPSKDKTGIARKRRPQWLLGKVRNVTVTNDFYAEAPDAIRPVFYAQIIRAEMELPFFVHVLKVAVPIILQIVPVFGGLFGPLGQLGVAAATGLGGMLPLLGGLMGQASAADEEVDRKLIEMLSITGIIQNIPGLIQLVAALPGLQAHGEYWMNRPEFGGRTGPEVGYDIIANFKR